MELIADFHIHSHYARATSPNMNLEELYFWGKMKGINIIGTGDFTHPAWFSEIMEKLEPAEPGLYKLKDELAQIKDQLLPTSVRNNIIRFVLTVEISSIYSKNGKVRKSHNLVIAPDFKTVSQLNAELGKIGNLKADGRPILGLDSKELLRMCLKINPDILFVPAHIWTPWFSMFGSKSGFNSIAEAFEELAPEIRAVETGLSSDPKMNWRISELDNLTLISNSDAHSAPKLAREANILNCELNYFEVIKAIKTGGNEFIGTIEFYPEEGRYHYDGHRACSISLSPSETKKINGLCPKCGKPLVIGVDYRVNELADPQRLATYIPQHPKKVEYIIPLMEVTAQLFAKTIISKIVGVKYLESIKVLGSEFDILRKLEHNEIATYSPDLALAITALRNGHVDVIPGYDGVYGIIKVKPDLQQIGLQL
jgi:uncharacterized protein (TIGR00375 family)